MTATRDIDKTDRFRYVGAVASKTRAMNRIIAGIKPDTLWFGQGYSKTGGSEHASGYAQDYIVSERVGKLPSHTERDLAKEVINWIIANYKAIGIKWLLFDYYNTGKTWSWNPQRMGWKELGDRGSVSANHRDHFHLYLTPEPLKESQLTTFVSQLRAPKPPETPSVSPPKAPTSTTLEEKIAPLKELVDLTAQRVGGMWTELSVKLDKIAADVAELKNGRG